MNKGNLCVFFYVGAKAEDEKILRQLEATTREVVANPISVITAREWGSDPSRAPRSDFRYSHAVNGANPADAVAIMATQNRDRKMVLITLCDDMMKAADAAGIRVITSGLPAENMSRSRSVIPTPLGLQQALRDIRLERD